MFGLSNLYAILGAAALAALSSGVASWYVTHQIDAATYLRREVALHQAEQLANQVALVKERADETVIRDAAVKQAASQVQIVTQTLTLQKEVIRHVTVHSPCISLGFIRVLDAEVLGVAADRLPLAAGQSDDTCSPLTADAVAERIIANYGRARQNAIQLDELEASVRALSSK